MGTAANTVGIMSMHRIHNYGSSLQAYALRRMIEALNPSSTVEYLDYRPGVPIVDAGPSGKFRRLVDKTVEHGKVRAPALHRLKFLNHKRAYGRKYFPELGIPRERNFEYAVDLQVIGSDEVFNCVQMNTNVGYSRDLFGHGTPARRLASYAASFGNTTLERIDAAGIRSEIQESLHNFDALSVRDANSQEIVHELTGILPQIHLDPALVFPFMEVERRIPAARLNDSPYIIVYGYSGRLSEDENASLRAYAQSAGAQILSFGGVQTCADKFVDCSPFELLSYFRDAEAVVTDTFHGTIFALINRRPFCSIVRKSVNGGYGNEEKLGYLLSVFDLLDHKVAKSGDVREVLDLPTDYDRVSAVLERERASTRRYLTELLGTGGA